MGPQAAQAGEVVLELGELDLELALGRVGVVGEDVEDHGRPVHHRDAELGLEVPLLARSQLVVAGDQVRVPGRDLALQLVDLAPAEVAVGVGLVAVLDQVAGGRHPGGPEQLLQLGELVAALRAVPSRGRRVHADGERALGGPAVLDAGASLAGPCGVSSSVLRHAHPDYGDDGRRAEIDGAEG